MHVEVRGKWGGNRWQRGVNLSDERAKPGTIEEDDQLGSTQACEQDRKKMTKRISHHTSEAAKVDSRE
ncbi:hypothetical protein R1flu_003963 [Riccia fluitans]|uniref:Uncharacterized protein n=1 Tax=Riccia fluitans TaxID=41844 RepID=A0ABD1YRY5_9MARC